MTIYTFDLSNLQSIPNTTSMPSIDFVHSKSHHFFPHFCHFYFPFSMCCHISLSHLPTTWLDLTQLPSALSKSQAPAVAHRCAQRPLPYFDGRPGSRSGSSGVTRGRGALRRAWKCSPERFWSWDLCGEWNTYMIICVYKYIYIYDMWKWRSLLKVPSTLCWNVPMI